MTRAPIDGALAEADDENGNSLDRQSLNTAHHQPASSLSPDPRSARRQRLVAHLHAAGPRPVLEALISVAAGDDLDEVLADFARVPVATYRARRCRRAADCRLTIIKGGER